jgi:putative CocE/NonD family hydrolase
VPAADGVPLMTDHYAPVTDEPCPTVMVRAPYVRIGFPFNYLYGVLFAEQGFHVVLQSSRGTGGSGGEFDPWHSEGDDGQATVAWLREQEWFNGELHTVGASYMTYTQWALAADPPPEWRGAVMQVGHTDPHDFFWRGGGFGYERALVGGVSLFTQNMTGKDYFRAILRLRRQLNRVTRGVPLLDVYPRAYGGRRPILEQWLGHPEKEFWHSSDLTPLADKLAVPVSLSTGWWDLSPEQVIEHYTRLRAAGHDPDLLIGPWTHTSALEDGWAELFAQAMRRLRGERSPYQVRVFVGGAGEWRDLPSWPPPGVQERRWFLGDGTLRDEESTGGTSFRYDPSDPTPSIGGRLQSPTQGQRDDAELEKRADVVVFTSPELLTAVEIMGAVRAEFDASTTAASGDLFARLCDVDPTGKSINICDGLTRFADAGRVVVDLGPAGHRFRPGHRIRLVVAGGAHPRVLRNYGTGEPPGPATRMVPTDTTVGHTSSLVLPVV